MLVLFTPSLMILSIPLTISRSSDWIVNSELNRILMKALWPNLRYYLVHLPVGTEDNHQNHNSRCLCRDSNWAPLQYKSKALTSKPTLLVFILVLLLMWSFETSMALRKTGRLPSTVTKFIVRTGYGRTNGQTHTVHRTSRSSG